MKATPFGREAVGDPSLVRRLRDGLDVYTGTADKIEAYIEEYWEKNPDLKPVQSNSQSQTGEPQ
ncbi:hypothetical protein IWQ49_006404 [Labrenzia sp. EL_126]|nr:hypothetical protein [Labrenzia sp. EL_126]